MAEGRHLARCAGRHLFSSAVTAGAVVLAAGVLSSQADSRPARGLVGEPGGHGAVAARPLPDTSRAGAPRLVRIPALGVTSRVVPMHPGDGTLVPPDDPRELGWWAEGARPGDTRGSVVMAGDTEHPGRGVLSHLDRLRPGDVVTVGTDRGVVRYDVRSVRSHDQGWVVQHAAEVFSQRVEARLVLVTCEDWNGDQFLSNVVITAAPQ